jgi:acyl dehydratase
MTDAPMVEQPIYFEDVAVGTRLPEREHGPLTIQDTVRWAGLQENWQHLHFDRDHVREHNGLRTFIASGAYRQALAMRLITDWVGPKGMLRKLTIRHTYSTFEGDWIRLSGAVVEKSPTAAEPWVACELEGHNQENRQLLTCRCTVVLPHRGGKGSGGGAP